MSIRHEPLALAKNAAYDEPARSLHIQLIMAVAAAHEIEEAAPGRHGTQHGTSERLVAHDRVVVQRRREPQTSFSQLIKAVAVAHEIVEAPPGRHATRHGMSDSQLLVEHDQVLVQRRRERRGLTDNLNMHHSFERPERNPETSIRAHLEGHHYSQGLQDQEEDACGQHRRRQPLRAHSPPQPAHAVA